MAIHNGIIVSKYSKPLVTGEKNNNQYMVNPIVDPVVDKEIYEAFGTCRWHMDHVRFNFFSPEIYSDRIKQQYQFMITQIVKDHINNRRIIYNHDSLVIIFYDAPMICVTFLPYIDEKFHYNTEYVLFHDKEMIGTVTYKTEKKEESKRTSLWTDLYEESPFYGGKELVIGSPTVIVFGSDKKEDNTMSNLFGEALKETALTTEFNGSMTENGAVGYKTTGKELLDMNFMVSSLREASEAEIMDRFSRVFFENKVLAIKFLFFVGDIRGGLGERRLFRICFNWLVLYSRLEAKNLLLMVPEYTRWDNLIYPIATDVDEVILSIFELVKHQLEEDTKNMKEGKPISLLAKWLPSLWTHNPIKKKFLDRYREYCGLSCEKYRKTLSPLRKYLDLVERKISNGEWNEVDYEKVPSRANLMYSNAFLKHDEERRKKYIEDVMNGKKKINSSILFPHDIAAKYYESGSFYSRELQYNHPEDSFEALWNNLADYVKGRGNTICVVDTSGSMFSNQTKDGLKIGIIAYAIGTYFAQRTSGYFKDKAITFSTHPKFIELDQCESLLDYLRVFHAYSEYSDTNIEAVFDLLLETAYRHKLNQEDIPANILILSDMEFNSCAVSDYNNDLSPALFDVIRKKWNQKGYKVPRLCFWNIYSRTETVPIMQNDLGVSLVSGFSPAIMDMVLSSETDPYKNLLKVLNGERYQKIEDIITNL